MIDEFECCHGANERFPDDMARWPAAIRTTCLFAMGRALDREPGHEVIEKTSCCIDAEHPGPFSHLLIYRVKFSVPSRAVG